MNEKCRFLSFFILLAVSVFLCGCGQVSEEVQAKWHDPQYSQGRVKGLLVILVSDNSLQKRTFEDTMGQFMREKGIMTESGYRVIPEDAGGGYFHDLGCHALDILFHIFGYPLEVTGKATNVAGMYEPEDSLSASLVLPDHLLVTGSWNFVSPEPFQKDLVEVVGEKGKLDFGIFSFKPIMLNTGDHKETIATIQPEHIQMPLIRTIVSELNGHGRCPSTGRTAEITSQVMDIIRGVSTSIL